MLENLRALSKEFDIFVVGGAVRDALLNEPTHDVDLLVPEHGFMAHLNQLSRALGLEPFNISGEHKLWRYDIKGQIIDVAPLGESLEENLRNRDFTVNSMAISLDYYLEGRLDKVHDPLNGKLHIDKKLLCATSPHSLTDDPVRILRAARLAAEQRFEVDASLTADAIRSAELLKDSPGERIWSELQRVVNSSLAFKIIDWLDYVGALAIIFPELEAEKGVEQNQYHSFCVYEHSRRAFKAYLEIWEDPTFLEAEIRRRVQQELTSVDPGISAVCKLGALLHDIGKPRAKAFRDDGRVTFYRHEQIGAEMVPAIVQRLKLSNLEAKALTRFVRWHTYLAQLARQPRLNDGHLHRIARRLGAYSVPIALFNVADLLGKGDDMTGDKSFAQMTAAVDRFLHAWFFRNSEIINPTLPITPTELAVQLGLSPGRWLNDTLSYLSEQAALGRLKDKEQAVRTARDYYRRMMK